MARQFMDGNERLKAGNCCGGGDGGKTGKTDDDSVG